MRTFSPLSSSTTWLQLSMPRTITRIDGGSDVRFVFTARFYERNAMAVRSEKNGPVWTVIHDRPEARNAMDPKSADELTAAFLEFDRAKDASVAVFWGSGGSFCAGWDLEYVSTLNAEYPLGELDIPTAGWRQNGGEIPRGAHAASCLVLRHAPPLASQG